MIFTHLPVKQSRSSANSGTGCFFRYWPHIFFIFLVRTGRRPCNDDGLASSSRHSFWNTKGLADFLNLYLKLENQFIKVFFRSLPADLCPSLVGRSLEPGELDARGFLLPRLCRQCRNLHYYPALPEREHLDHSGPPRTSWWTWTTSWEKKTHH